MQSAAWQLQPQWIIPEKFQEWLSAQGEPFNHPCLAQLLWQRGIRDPTTAQSFLIPEHYTPTSPWAFGEEMQHAITRLQRAHERQEKVYIWGDFDADGLTATAVLWEGLADFFRPRETLFYTLPNRLTESHGLSQSGLDRLAADGCTLVITCDNGSHNLAELVYAQTLGLDVIVTDHHTLPLERPPVIAIINPRTFPPEHPLAHLSGVAVAYKLLEALYAHLPDIPQRPLTDFLDLVAIGLIADLVALKGDCRYLAQQGLEQLQQQLITRSRPGVAKLLELCRRTGDRPTDIGFGLGPRINALSRIHGDARAGVHLLTSQNVDEAEALAEQAEWTNLYRKEVQQRTLQQVDAKLQSLDLNTTTVIVLSDPQWSVGILGLVANQIAQTYGRPTILLSEEQIGPVGPQSIARGSARSITGIDLYSLLQRQSQLLLRYGGHPFAAGLSLLKENLPLFSEAINQDLRQQGPLPKNDRIADLRLTLADIGDGIALFKAFKLLEPFGMGHPTPCLLLENVWLDRATTRTLRDRHNQKLSYQRTTFQVRDDSFPQGIPGILWGKWAADLPQSRCAILAELDYNTSVKPNGYHLRVIAIQSQNTAIAAIKPEPDWILDWRSELTKTTPVDTPIIPVQDCPISWGGLEPLAHQAKYSNQKLALTYAIAPTLSPEARWQTLVGIAKYLARTGQSVTLLTLCDRCQLSTNTLNLGLTALESIGFQIKLKKSRLQFQFQAPLSPVATTPEHLQACFVAIAEETFRQQYFQTASVQLMQQTLEQRL
jgi:single-stranded-DNA-specific exonuclease